jgi:hypothetical protein
LPAGKKAPRPLYPGGTLLGGTLLMSRRFGVECGTLDAACWCQLAVT